uniref:Uncharacterized protein n=1 Tax=Arundo donax TaxID=35708 RepID=A0A0A8Y4P8_ARUDO
MRKLVLTPGREGEPAAAKVVGLVGKGEDPCS